MEQMKRLIATLKNNLVEIWLALLLFVLIPLTVFVYIEPVVGILLSLVAQAVVLVLFIRKKGN